MSEEIKQKAREELKELFPLEYLRNEIDNFGYASLENWIDSLLSQALQKRDSQIIEMIKSIELKVYDKTINPDVIDFYRDAMEETKKQLLSTLTTK